MSSPGDDTYIGGDGVDGISFSYTNVANGVKADLLTGIATGHGTDTLDGIENLSGTPYRDTLLGDNRTYINYLPARSRATSFPAMVVGTCSTDAAAGLTCSMADPATTRSSPDRATTMRIR